MTRDEIENLITLDGQGKDVKTAALQALLIGAKRQALEEAFHFLHVECLAPESFSRMFDTKFNLGKFK